MAAPSAPAGRSLDRRREAVAAVGARQDRHRVQRLRAGVLLRTGARRAGSRSPTPRPRPPACPSKAFCADALRGLEALDLHRVGAVVAAALEHRAAAATPGILREEVAALEADRLRAQVAGRVVGDRSPGVRLEVGVEARLVADRPQELARDPRPPRPAARRARDPRRRAELGLLAAHHHRAGRVDRHHLGARARRRASARRGCARARCAASSRSPLLPGRHAAAREARRAADVDLVLLAAPRRVSRPISGSLFCT